MDSWRPDDTRGYQTTVIPHSCRVTKLNGTVRKSLLRYQTLMSNRNVSHLNESKPNQLNMNSTQEQHATKPSVSASASMPIVLTPTTPTVPKTVRARHLSEYYGHENSKT